MNTPTWATFSGLGQVDNNGLASFQRFGGVAGAGTSGAVALVVGGSQSTTVPGTTLTISTAGVPSFTHVAALALPSGSFRSAGASADGSFWVSGGSTALGPAMCNAGTRGNLPAVARLLRMDGSFTGAWTQLADMPVARVEHGMVATETTGGTEDKLYVIGGQNGAGALSTVIFEYTP